MPAAIGLVFNQDKTEILLVQRSDIPVWVLPGGGMEQEETPEEAACREVEEETGLVMGNLRRAANLQPKHVMTSTTYLIEGRHLSGSLKKSSECRDVAFFSLDTLPKELFYLHKLWIDKVLLAPTTTLEETIVEVTWKKAIAYFFQHPLWSLRFLWTRLVSS